jgi:uncharacterized protein YjiS (DUF1127 family)
MTGPWAETRSGAIDVGRGDLWRRLAGLAVLWHERARQRHALAQLSDEHLRDIGISRSDARREACQPFWRA